MAVVYLTGVLEDGTALADGVPQNPRASLTVTQGVSTQVLLRCVTSSGVPLPTSGVTTLTVKKRPQDGTPLVQLTGSWSAMLIGPGIAVFTFPANALTALEWGRYIYDIKLVADGATNVLVPASPFQIAPAL